MMGESSNISTVVGAYCTVPPAGFAGSYGVKGFSDVPIPQCAGTVTVG